MLLLDMQFEFDYDKDSGQIEVAVNGVNSNDK